MRRVCLPITISILLAVVSTISAHAATFIVTNTANSGAGSLRQALINAGTDTTNPRIIRFGAVFPQGGTIQLQSALPTWSNDMLEIDGNGREPVLDGGNAVRIFSAAAGTRALTLRGLEFRRGRTTSGMGGCLWHASPTANTELYVYNMRFANCIAVGNGINAQGGAIHWFSPGSTVFIRDSNFSANSAGAIGSGSTKIMAGGAIRIQGRLLQITSSRFADNVVERISGSVQGLGGAVYLEATDLVLMRLLEFESNAVIDANAGGAASAGGAAVLACQDPACVLDITNTSFIDNTISGADILGGALGTTSSRLNLLNVSFSGNRAATGSAGALLMLGGELDARHVSFTDNQAAYGAHLGLADVEVIRWTWSLVDRVAAGSGVGCALDASVLTGPTFSNLFENDCGLLSASGATLGPVGPLALDRSVFPAMLAPGAGSPAIDLPGSDAQCFLGYDGRGVARPQDGNGDGIARCDAGAVEVPERLFVDGFDGAP